MSSVKKSAKKRSEKASSSAMETISSNQSVSKFNDKISAVTASGIKLTKGVVKGIMKEAEHERNLEVMDYITKAITTQAKWDAKERQNSIKVLGKVLARFVPSMGGSKSAAESDLESSSDQEDSSDSDSDSSTNGHSSTLN